MFGLTRDVIRDMKPTLLSSPKLVPKVLCNLPDNTDKIPKFANLSF